MQAGKLRHRVTIQSKNQSQDPSTGEMLHDWQDVATTWARIEHLSVKEYISAGAEKSEITARIVMRYREIDRSMRIIHGGKMYNIQGVLPDNQTGNKYVTLAVSEGVNDGN